MSKQCYLVVSLVANCLLAAFILLYDPKAAISESRPLYTNKVTGPESAFELEFIPKRPVISCNDLFTDIPINAFSMSANFDRLYTEFESAINASVGGRKGPVAGYFDGHSHLLPEQFKALHYMARLNFVHTICETGFNYGHSSFNFLTANDNVTVHSFDLGSHEYTKHMANYLSTKFPGRFFIHYGDSTKSVPAFLQQNQDIRCDLIFVDGSHTYSVAKSDLENFIKVASKLNIIAMDDYPTNYGAEYGKAWEELVAKGKIDEIMRCRFKEIVYKHVAEAAFALGSAVSEPHGVGP